ncbi:ubiquitin fusion degradation protein 1 (UFD1) [Vairimorpha necatrix]|uniref:Ubiquitin fusion degradation protein 1 (UFD1) n=1 Tax=Vairimorpha necatrix TaxID=6039 RepID=A0AAX4JDK4_9MICR
MFFNLFGRWSENPTWKLKSYKFQEEDPNNYGGKVFLPQSVLEDFVVLQIQPPYTFQIERTDKSKSTHCGVLEFTAEEDSVFIPRWIHNQLGLQDGEEIKLSYKIIEHGTHLKLLPHSPNFLEVENPKLELENVLKFYPTLGRNDEIECLFSEIGLIKFTVTEIEPSYSQVIYTVDTDLSVDFCEPLGYQEKLEDEKTVNKYLEIKKTVDDIKIIGMKKLGLSFDTNL